MCGKYPKNPVVGGCRQLLCWGLPQQGRAQLATSAPSPFLWLLVSSTLGVVFLSQEFTGLEFGETKTRGKGPFDSCFSWLQTTGLSLSLQTSAILRDVTPGAVCPIPCPVCPFLHPCLWVQGGHAGAPGQCGGWAGGCEEEEEEGAVLPLQSDSRIQP